MLLEHFRSQIFVFLFLVALRIRTSAQIKWRHCFHLTSVCPLVFVSMCAPFGLLSFMSHRLNTYFTSTMIKCNYIHHHGVHTAMVLAHRRLQGQRMHVKRDGTAERGSKSQTQTNFLKVIKYATSVWICGSGHTVHILM